MDKVVLGKRIQERGHLMLDIAGETEQGLHASLRQVGWGELILDGHIAITCDAVLGFFACLWAQHLSMTQDSG